jgi:succinyl-diaminopimelate desuccinylase
MTVPCVSTTALRAAIRAREQSMIELAQRLVRCDSQTPASDTRAAVEIAGERLSAIPGVTLREYESRPPIANLVARLRGSRPGKRLVLSGHLDTYPIGDRKSWTVDPLGGELIDGRLYGRGSADMKGGVAALVAVMEAFAEAVAPDFAGELVLALAGDEESMGELGTQWLIDNVPEARGDGVIVADVGAPAVVRLGEKGMIWVDLEAEGKASHGAHVHLGSNAIDSLFAALQAIKRLEALQPAPSAEISTAIAEAKPISELLGGAGEADVLQRVTVNLGLISGGTSANLVPARASASLDIRLPMGISVVEAERHMRELLAPHGGVRATVTRRYEPTWTPPSDPLARVMLDASRAVLDRDVTANMRIGGSDARLWRRAGIPTVVAGLTPHNLGGPDEFLEVSELVPLAQVHAVAAARFL